MADRHTLRALQGAMDALEPFVRGLVVNYRDVELTLFHRPPLWRAYCEREGERLIDGEGASPLAALDACVDAVEAHDEHEADAEARADAGAW